METDAALFVGRSNSPRLKIRGHGGLVEVVDSRYRFREATSRDQYHHAAFLDSSRARKARLAELDVTDTLADCLALPLTDRSHYGDDQAPCG